MNCLRCGEKLLDLVAMTVSLGGPQICGSCIDSQRSGVGKMTDADNKERLRMALLDYKWVHCNGCDGWLCPEVVNENERKLSDMVDAVWKEISSWKED